MEKFKEAIEEYGIFDEDKIKEIYDKILRDVPESAKMNDGEEVCACKFLCGWMEQNQLPVISSYYTIEHDCKEVAWQHCLLEAVLDRDGIPYYLAKTDSLDNEDELIEKMQTHDYLLYPWRIGGGSGDEIIADDVIEFLRYAGANLRDDKEDILVEALTNPDVIKAHPDKLFYGLQAEVLAKVQLCGGKAYRNIWCKVD